MDEKLANLNNLHDRSFIFESIHIRINLIQYSKCLSNPSMTILDVVTFINMLLFIIIDKNGLLECNDGIKIYLL
jgi:hypothetical protein